MKNRAGELKNKHLLDIGCATGELAFKLAQEGAIVTGIDLNDDLLEQAKSKKNHPGHQFQKGDMLALRNDFQPRQFNGVLCFGNTLVHLLSTGSIASMLEGVQTVLKPGGVFLLQILNYDYILDEKLTELPLIETENVTFIRRYVFEENSPLIRFQTELHLKKEEKILRNETLLLALKSSELKHLLKNVSFENVEFFSSFKEEPFGGKHLPLVVSTVK
ncbi:MAG: class I SAM-dependent methyltransferase [Bacillota bacterium]